MPLMPKRTKFRKVQKGRMRGKATRGNKVTDGEYGIQAVTAGLITSNQIEAARIAMTRYIKRGGKVWIKIFPDKPITSKPIGTRMGKGKGAPEYWVAVVKPGRVMFEIAGVSEEVAREALRLAMNKLPNKTKFVAKETEKVGDNDEEKINKIREMSSPELEKELGELKTELFKLKFSLATNGLDNPMKIKEVKRDIAKINTVLTERKIAESKKA